MTVHAFTFNPFQTNSFIVHGEKEAILIDASCSEPAEFAGIEEYLDRHGLKVTRYLLTHGHIDHIMGCAYLARERGASFAMHRADLPFIERAVEQGVMFGTPIEQPPRPEKFLNEGDSIEVEGATLDVLHVPGHSPGSVAFVDRANGYVIGGDVLFMNSIGRTDLPGGSLPELMESIFQKFIPLGDEFVVYPGHGPATTIGEERRNNPFLNGAA
jgi:hydroxyacylglutathione hydrolase